MLDTDDSQQYGHCRFLIGRIFRYPKSDVGKVNLNQRLSLSVDMDDPEKPVHKPSCFFMGPDGLAMMAQNGPDNVFDSLLHLGLSHTWIEDHLCNKGNRFALLVIDGRGLSSPATWEGLFSVVSTNNPELIPYVEQYSKRCQNEPQFVLLPEFIAKFESVERVEIAHMMHDPTIVITPRRFLLNTEKSFVDFRVMLWQWFSVNQYFNGSGRTVDSATGAEGVTELFVPNMSLVELTSSNYNARVIELTVQLPNTNVE